VKLWLVRHAQPCVAPGLCYGAWDMPADAAATQAAAQALAQTLPPNAPVWVSPLQRCELLAHVLRGLRPDLTFKTDARLVEMDFGIWEGVPWAEVDPAAMDAWVADFGEHRFGGQESCNRVLARVAAAWHATYASVTPAQDAVWITHAGVIRAAQLIAQGIRQVHNADQWPREAPGYGQWCCLMPICTPD
jgi:alpha-ribazole phosphatase